MIRLSHDQLVACIYSSDPIGEYESILDRIESGSNLVGDEKDILSQCVKDSLIEMFDSEDDGFSDDWIEEDYHDPFFDDHNIADLDY